MHEFELSRFHLLGGHTSVGPLAWHLNGVERNADADNDVEPLELANYDSKYENTITIVFIDRFYFKITIFVSNNNNHQAEPQAHEIATRTK